MGGPAPEASVRPLGHGLDLGERVDPSQARAAVDFAIRAPRELGPPNLVYLDGSRIWLVYRARPGLPAAEETGVGLLVTEFRGSVDESLLKKVTMEGGTVTPIQVDGNRGYYVEGAHSLLFLDGSGNVIEERTRVAGNVLVWEEGGVTYRLESALGLGESVAIAGSMA